MTTLVSALNSYKDFRIQDNQITNNELFSWYKDGSERLNKMHFVLGSYLTAPLELYENSTLRLALLDKHIEAVDKGDLSSALVLWPISIVVDMLARAILSCVALIGAGINSLSILHLHRHSANQSMQPPLPEAPPPAADSLPDEVSEPAKSAPPPSTLTLNRARKFEFAIDPETLGPFFQSPRGPDEYAKLLTHLVRARSSTNLELSSVVVQILPSSVPQKFKIVAFLAIQNAFGKQEVRHPKTPPLLLDKSAVLAGVPIAVNPLNGIGRFTLPPGVKIPADRSTNPNLSLTRIPPYIRDCTIVRRNDASVKDTLADGHTIELLGDDGQVIESYVRGTTAPRPFSFTLSSNLFHHVPMKPLQKTA